jgi:hypothetical protein
VLEQIKLAPAIRRSFYPFLEDYVEKERNLRYMLRKLSQNFICAIKAYHFKTCAEISLL